MEQQEPTEFILDVFADPRSVRDVVKGNPIPLPRRHTSIKHKHPDAVM